MKHYEFTKIISYLIDKLDDQLRAPISVYEDFCFGSSSYHLKFTLRHALSSRFKENFKKSSTVLFGVLGSVCSFSWAFTDEKFNTVKQQDAKYIVLRYKNNYKSKKATKRVIFNLTTKLLNS